MHSLTMEHRWDRSSDEGDKDDDDDDDGNDDDDDDDDETYAASWPHVRETKQHERI